MTIVSTYAHQIGSIKRMFLREQSIPDLRTPKQQSTQIGSKTIGSKEKERTEVKLTKIGSHSDS